MKVFIAACVSMLAHCGPYTALIRQFVESKSHFLSRQAAQWKRLFSASCHYTASVPSHCVHTLRKELL